MRKKEKKKKSAPVRKAFLFPKVGLAKGLVAVRAHKVFRVPHAVQRRHGAAHDGLAARRAHFLEHAQIVLKAAQATIRKNQKKQKK
jgi:hypothetical protein